ncbi:MAG: DNA alkylation repair protein [Lautropia sp.]|nr:DNA alkylation repair protein [Lautropia sp.]
MGHYTSAEHWLDGLQGEHMAGIIAARLALLNQGEVASSNLGEALAVDQRALIEAVLPGLGVGQQQLAQILEAFEPVSSKGISHQISAIGVAVGRVCGHDDVLMARLRGHTSDTLRSWAAFADIRSERLGTLAQRLEAARPYAADIHFGVREWAWIAARPFIARQLDEAFSLLMAWTSDDDPNVRRFASESTRPRGVWCEHIGALKDSPEMAEALLSALNRDESRYVQDSVANWLNDASKTRPDWVWAVCGRWQIDGDANTKRIITRALRSLRKKQGEGR